jgi:hypothetical protein
MLEVLNKHLTAKADLCAMGQWINTLDKKTQEAFDAIKENNKSVVLVELYNDLAKETELPFKITVFRSHLRGYCTCQSR